jgi:hypothetical protein
MSSNVDIATMWDEAEKREAERRASRPMSFYGKLELNGRKVVLEKGAPMGKRDFDPDMDDPDLERLAIRITVEPVSERATRNFEREFLSNSPEADLFKQSAQALGVRVPELMGQYIRVDLVEDPRLGTFTDRTTGAPRTRSAAVVREVFPDEQTCREASDARYGGGGGAKQTAAHAGDWGVAPVPPPASAASEASAVKPNVRASGTPPTMARDTAAHFLPGLLKTCGGDRERFLQALGQNKLLAQHFDETSPEVEKLLGTGPQENEGGDVDLETTPF